jgi:hypothetical protein
VIPTGKKRNACRDLVGRNEGKVPFGRGSFDTNILLRLFLQK